MSSKYWAIIALLGIGWGSSFYFNEILLRELGPLSVAMGRVGLGALGCWIYLVATGGYIPLSPGRLGALFFLGAVQYAIPFAMYALAQQYITGGAAGIINALMPVMVVIVSHVWPGGEKATLAKSAGVVFGFAGICVMALPALQRGGGSEFWGLLMAALAPVCYAVAVNFNRRFAQLNPSAIAAWGLTGATVLIVPLALWAEGVPVITQGATWASLAVIGFVLTSASFIVVYWLLPRVGATNFSTVTFIAPISAVVLGVTLLEEQVSAAQIIGMAAIFCGLLLIDGRVLRAFRAGRAPDHQPKG